MPGKAISETRAGANSAADRHSKAPKHVPMSTFQLLNIFSSTPMRSAFFESELSKQGFGVSFHIRGGR